MDCEIVQIDHRYGLFDIIAKDFNLSMKNSSSHRSGNLNELDYPESDVAVNNYYLGTRFSRYIYSLLNIYLCVIILL